MMDHDEVEILLKRERRRQGRERLGLVAMVLGLVGGGIGLALGRSGTIWDAPSDIPWMSAFALSILGAIAVLVWRPRSDARRLEALIGRRDRMQRGRNDQIYALSISTWGLLAAAISPLLRITQGQADGHDYLFVTTLPLAALLIMMFVGGWDGFGNSWARQNRKWLEDEFTRAMRGRAMALGFPVLMGAMGAVYLLGLWRPEWALVAMPVALIGAASVVGLRFAWLDRQAEVADD